MRSLLAALGHAVYRNISPIGPVDLIALKGSEVILIDVTSYSVQVNKNTGKVKAVCHPSKLVIPDGMRRIYVTPDGVCFWDYEEGRTYCMSRFADGRVDMEGLQIGGGIDWAVTLKVGAE